MRKQIRYYPEKSLNEESYTYSDEKLAEVIQELSADISEFHRIFLWYAWMDDDIAELWVTLDAGKDVKLGESKTIMLHLYNLLQDDVNDIQKESNRIKRFLKHKFSEIQVSSGLYIR